MPKRSRTWDKNKYMRYLGEGRGQGNLSSYKPWIMVQDFPSNGMVSRVYGNTTQRVHHLLSNNELCYFYILDWSKKTIDIKEQFPLVDLELAIWIAKKLGVCYPNDKVSGFPYVLTSDFMIVSTSGVKIRTVKMVSELKRRRVIEKLEIERRYWLEQGIDWGIVTEKEINKNRAYNIEWLTQARDLTDFMVEEGLSITLSKIFLKYCTNTNLSYAEIIHKVEDEFNLRKGVGLCIFKHLAHQRKIAIDIDRGNILDNLLDVGGLYNTMVEAV